MGLLAECTVVSQCLMAACWLMQHRATPLLAESGSPAAFTIMQACIWQEGYEWAAEHLIEDDLGRKVVGGAAEGVRALVSGHHLREAQVRDLHVAGVVQQQVLRLQQTSEH